jgi:hypothetical protein
MRIANFRDDVLWAIVYLQGQDPTKNFDDDQAAALVSFINAWVRRTYDAEDYNEWTNTDKFTVPTTPPARAHIVPYSVIPSIYGTDEHKRVQIGRVFKVYLRDPQLTALRPLDTPHTLRPEGVHVGFEHGDFVWIKYIEQPPQFTSNVWNPNHTYPKGELTYSPTSGQCYMSLGETNRGYDPSRSPHILLPTELVQEHLPPTMEMPARNKILDLGLTGTKPGPDPANPPAAGSTWSVMIGSTIFADAGMTPVTYTATGAETLAAVATSLAAALDAAYPSFVSITADNTDPSKPVIRIEDASDFSVEGTWTTPDIGDSFTISSELHQVVRQPYSVGSPPSPRTRQIMTVTLPDDMVMGDTIYSLTFRSPDGLQHYVEYQGLHTDGAAQILTGLANQITVSADPWMATVQPSLDTINSVLSLSAQDEFSLEAVAEQEDVIHWKLIRFPFELIDQVVRGAYANAMKEEGQTEKGMAEEKLVPQEMLVSVNSNLQSGAGKDRMTDQVGAAVVGGAGK